MEKLIHIHLNSRINWLPIYNEILTQSLSWENLSVWIFQVSEYFLDFISHILLYFYLLCVDWEKIIAKLSNVEQLLKKRVDITCCSQISQSNTCLFLSNFETFDKPFSLSSPRDLRNKRNYFITDFGHNFFRTIQFWQNFKSCHSTFLWLQEISFFEQTFFDEKISKLLFRFRNNRNWSFCGFTFH